MQWQGSGSLPLHFLRNIVLFPKGIILTDLLSFEFVLVSKKYTLKGGWFHDRNQEIK